MSAWMWQQQSYHPFSRSTKNKAELTRDHRPISLKTLTTLWHGLHRHPSESPCQTKNTMRRWRMCEPVVASPIFSARQVHSQSACVRKPRRQRPQVARAAWVGGMQHLPGQRSHWPRVHCCRSVHAHRLSGRRARPQFGSGHLRSAKMSRSRCRSAFAGWSWHAVVGRSQARADCVRCSCVCIRGCLCVHMSVSKCSHSLALV